MNVRRFKVRDEGEDEFKLSEWESRLKNSWKKFSIIISRAHDIILETCGFQRLIAKTQEHIFISQIFSEEKKTRRKIGFSEDLWKNKLDFWEMP